MMYLRLTYTFFKPGSIGKDNIHSIKVRGTSFCFQHSANGALLSLILHAMSTILQAVMTSRHNPLCIHFILIQYSLTCAWMVFPLV